MPLPLPACPAAPRAGRSSSRERRPWPTFLLLAPAILFVPLAADGQEDPAAKVQLPIGIRVFYSQQDPTWPKAAEAIEKVQQKYADKVKIERLDIENVENYKALAKIEKEIPIKPTGDITAVISNFALTSQGAVRRDVETYLESAIEAMLKPKKGPMHGNLQAFAKETFGAGVQAMKPDGPGTALALFRNGQAGGAQPVGWVEEMNKVVDCPVCADVSFLVALGPSGKVVSLKSLREIDLYGKPVEEKTSAFLGQFMNRPVNPGWAVDHGVQGITGATKTCRMYVNALKEVSVHYNLYRDQHPDKYKDVPLDPPPPPKKGPIEEKTEKQ